MGGNPMRAGFITLAGMALAVGLGMAGVRPASAQINPFHGAFANRLTNDDFQMMGTAVTSLLDRETLTVGATEGWRNPASGSSGTVEIARDFKRGSYACHVVKYTVLPGGAGGLSTSHIVLNWCKTKAGWKIV
jgi:surface antigen